jgi:protein O-GlcNAc transferase
MNKIISMSLWGNDPKYGVGAIKNAQLAKKLMPDWKCRIFVDQTVPIEYQQHLYDMDNVELAELDCDGTYGMFWRFYSMFESDDNISISRDSDSRITEREVRCLDEWLESDKKFSIIRDHGRHYDWPIFGGMWGMKGMMDDRVFDLMKKYSEKHQYVIDQVFLKDVVWPIAQNDCIIHGFREIDWMKEGRRVDNFIGQGYTSYDRPIYSVSDSGEKLI